MTKYYSEYRINKRGCECFRTDSFEIARAKLDELNAKRPGIYTMQTRAIHLDRYGCRVRQAGTGRELWETWQDMGGIEK